MTIATWSLDNPWHRAIGPRLFDYPNSLSGWDHRLYWIKVEATGG
jgi:hypothetical protein